MNYIKTTTKPIRKLMVLFDHKWQNNFVIYIKRFLFTTLTCTVYPFPLLFSVMTGIHYCGCSKLYGLCILQYCVTTTYAKSCCLNLCSHPLSLSISHIVKK